MDSKIRDLLGECGLNVHNITLWFAKVTVIQAQKYTIFARGTTVAATVYLARNSSSDNGRPFASIRSRNEIFPSRHSCARPAPRFSFCSATVRRDSHPSNVVSCGICPSRLDRVDSGTSSISKPNSRNDFSTGVDVDRHPQCRLPGPPPHGNVWSIGSCAPTV